jgi:hypothetical protein
MNPAETEPDPVPDLRPWPGLFQGPRRAGRNFLKSALLAFLATVLAPAWCAAAGQSLSVHGYRHGPSGRTIATIWISGDVPSNEDSKIAVDLEFRNANSGQPLHSDFRTDRTYEIPHHHWSSVGGVVTLRQVPVYDSPVLIADAAALPREPAISPTKS